MSLDKFIQDGQDPKVVEKIYSKIEDMLTNGEAVRYIAIQKKPAVTLLPDCIIISDRRIFLCEFTKLGLSTNFEIFEWKNIKDITFKEEIFGSKVTVIPFTAENLSIDYIPKTQARKLFQLIKDALENCKLEDRENKKPATPFVPEKLTTREVVIREIQEQPKEETKVVIEEAKLVESIPTVSSPIVESQTFTATVQTQETKPEEEDDEITIKLKKLKTLYDKQLISQSEYENKKAEILEQL